MARPTREEIRDEVSAASDSLEEHKGTRWSGMSYEDGVIAALSWAAGDTPDKPMED